MKVRIDFENDFPTLSCLSGDFDLFINGFNDCETIKYRNEINGQSQRLKELCALSEKSCKVIISAFDTDNYGIIKRSAGVFNNGKLLGISDMSVSYSDSGYMPGSGGKLFDTSAGKIGLIIEDDLYSFSLFKSLAICGAEFIIGVTNFKKKEINSVLIRAYSYLLGIPSILVFSGGAYYSDTNGSLTHLASQNPQIEMLPFCDFLLKTTKIKLKK